MKRPETAMTLIHEIIGDAPFLYEGSFTDGIAHAEKLGYDCVEIHASSADELKDPSLFDALESCRVRVSALGTGRLYVNAGLSLTSPDAANRSEAVRQLKGFIDCARKLGCLVILGCVRGNIPAPSDRPEVLRLLGESLKELDQYAQAHSVCMVFEPINRYENNYLCSTYEVADFIRQYELANTRMMIDTFHMNIEEKDICQSIIDNLPYIKYPHFADSNRLYPGQGHIDFPVILETLLSNGYNGVISAECLPLPTKDEAARGWLMSMKELLEQYAERNKTNWD